MRLALVVGIMASASSVPPGAQAQEFALLEHRYEQPETAGEQDLLTSEEARSRVLLPATYREALYEPLIREAEKVLIAPDRERLYARCDARFDAMLEVGALEEARAMAARGLDPVLPAMKAVGAPELFAHLRGEMTLEEAATAAKQATRNYAKRQMTWMRNQMKDWGRLNPA